MEALVIAAQQDHAHAKRAQLADEGRIVEPRRAVRHFKPPQNGQRRVLEETNLDEMGIDNVI